MRTGDSPVVAQPAFDFDAHPFNQRFAFAKSGLCAQPQNEGDNPAGLVTKHM